MANVTNEAAILGEDVAGLYTAYGKLSALASSNPESIAAESATYQQILNAVKGSDQVKQLAADYIPQFLHFFPDLVETGINAQLDLCEDDSVMIRIHAIKGLESICRHLPSTVGRIADMLGQLLLSEESVELNVVKATLASLFNIDAKQAFIALCQQVSSGVDVTLRGKGLEFLQHQLKQMQAQMKKDSETAAAVCTGLKTMLSQAQNALIGAPELRFLLHTIINLSPHAGNTAKVRTDATLKSELLLILTTQSGLKDGSAPLDLSSEAAVQHFLAIQPIVHQFASMYDLDTSTFIQVFFAQILPNLDAMNNAELRTKLMHATTAAATRIQPKQAQAFFPTMWNMFKKYIPNGEIKKKDDAAASAASASSSSVAATASPTPSPAASSSDDGASTPSATTQLNFASAEVALYLFHLFAPHAPDQLKVATGIFTPTGQPTDFAADAAERRAEFTNRIEYLMQENATYKTQLQTVRKRMEEQIRNESKQLSAIKKGKPDGQPAAAATAAPSLASAGQPLAPSVEKKEAEASSVAESPVAAVSVDDRVAAHRETLKDLRSKQHSVSMALRVANSIIALASPLLVNKSKPTAMPTFLKATQMNLSWKSGDKKPAADAKKGAPAQSSQTAKGGKLQQQQQKQTGKGQKRKSVGEGSSSSSGQGSRAASNKKRTASGAPKQQQQQQQLKKQRTQAGGPQQRQQQQQQQGGRSQKNKRRRR